MDQIGTISARYGSDRQIGTISEDAMEDEGYVSSSRHAGSEWFGHVTWMWHFLDGDLVLQLRKNVSR